MNTASLSHTKPLFTRVLWKEYRMLRGFWIAGFAIAFFIQWFFSAVINRSGPIPEFVFLVAWGAAALYSVGAAITLFAAETEERTRDYLRLLPSDWIPMFASKVALAAITMLLLGLALSFTGAWLEGWPTSQAARLALGVAGVAAVEGLSWGLLFSLWWRQPLLAAVAAMASGSLGAQLAISFGTSTQGSWTAEAYSDAAAARLLICLGVFAGAVLLGRRWFYPQAPASEHPNTLDSISITPIERPRKLRLPQSKMFTRLLWQTVRESWKSMLAGIVLGFVIFILLMIPEDLVPRFRGYWMLLMSLVPVAILGALVFRPDQQRDHRLFVATHAIPPRRLWWSRQIVWLALIVAIGIVANLCFFWAVSYITHSTLKGYLRGDWYYTELMGREFSNQESPWTQAWRLDRSRELYQQTVLAAWCAVIAVYGAGQFCSMLLKQSVLSGFLAILFSIVIAAWSLLIFLWQMSPLIYVLPIGMAALVATWLRIPSWVIGRNAVRYWVVPAILLILPIALLMPTVPGVRSRQLEIPKPQYPFLKESFAQMAGNFQARYETREILGDEIAQLFHKIKWPGFEDVIIDDPSWLEFEITDEQFESYQRDKGAELPDAELKLMRRLETAQKRLRAKRNQDVIKNIMRLTENPFFSQVANYGYASNMAELLEDDAKRLTTDGDLSAAWERLKAQARFDDSLHYDDVPYLNAIIAWAEHPDQTTDQLKSAMVDLHHIFQLLPEPQERLLDEYQRSRLVILEKEPPSRSPSPLVFMSNRLPGEQQRALTALDMITTQALNYSAAVVYLSRGGISSSGNPRLHVDNPRELVRMAPSSPTYAIHEIAYNGKLGDFLQANRIADTAATSFFASWQLDQSMAFSHIIWQWVDSETRRRATMMQLALLAYRIDHGEYPKSLAELRPDYLPDALSLRTNDPYSNKPFQYHPQGLEFSIKIFNDRYIPANTPILWSVGTNNYRLLEQFEDDDNGMGQAIYSFEPTERGGHGYRNLTFELPK